MINEAVSEAEMATENFDTSYSGEADISANMTSDSIGKEVTNSTHEQFSARYDQKALAQFTQLPTLRDWLAHNVLLFSFFIIFTVLLV